MLYKGAYRTLARASMECLDLLDDLGRTEVDVTSCTVTRRRLVEAFCLRSLHAIVIMSSLYSSPVSDNQRHSASTGHRMLPAWSVDSVTVNMRLGRRCLTYMKPSTQPLG